MIDPGVSVRFTLADGQVFTRGDVVAGVEGTGASILMGERAALNFLGHLSGVATATRRYVDRLRGTGIRVLDTRKTLPGLRLLEKRAVVHGGGCNHRMGLYDMVLVKDNHIDAAGSITEAVRRVRDRHGNTLPIEVETRNLKEVREAAGLCVDRIMLDNMGRRAMKRACAAAGGRAEIEASGNLTLRRVRRLRRLPLDFISVGTITSTPGHADFSLLVDGGHEEASGG